MNVLFSYPFCGLGGVETVLLTRAGQLRRMGIGAEVVFSDFYGEGGRTLPGGEGVRVGIDAETVAREASERSIDVVVAVDFPDLVDALGKSRFTGAVLFETHTSHVDLARNFYRGASSKYVRRVVVPSAFNAMRVLTIGTHDAYLALIPNPLDIQAFSPRSSRQLEIAFGSLPDGPVLLWIGRLEPEKNPKEFIALASAVMAARPTVSAIVIGDVPHDPEEAQAVQESVPAELRHRFDFHDYVPYVQIPLYYSLAAATEGCFVSTSKAESVPMVLLEATACGCPVLTTRVGGVEEIVADGETGMLYNVGDVDGGIRQLEAILGDSAATRHRVLKGLHQVRSRHAVERSADLYARLLDDVVAEMNPQRATSVGRPDSGASWMAARLRQTTDMLRRTNSELEELAGRRGWEDPSREQ